VNHEKISKAMWSVPNSPAHESERLSVIYGSVVVSTEGGLR
jgi:hypothetical protein